MPHLCAPPATPTTRQPLRLASWPTPEPTAPLAAETTTVSPSFGAMIRFRPYHAVMPGMPTAPRYADSGTRVVSTLRIAAPSVLPYSCQPNMPITLSPTANVGFSFATTPPAVPHV